MGPSDFSNLRLVQETQIVSFLSSPGRAVLASVGAAWKQAGSLLPVSSWPAYLAFEMIWDAHRMSA